MSGREAIMTTPTPGQPLSEADVSLLQPGDWLLVSAPDSFLRQRGFIEGRPVRLRSAEGGWIDLADLPYTQGTSPARFTFLGRPDQDGWIAWSGGENPVPGREVTIHMRGELIPTEVTDNNTGLSDAVDWGHRGGNGDIIAYRPYDPVSRPAGEGERERYLRANLDVVWAAVEDMAKIGIQVARTNKDYATEDRDRARIDFIGEVCRRWALRPAAPDAGGGWMPIETAPKDGTQVVLWCIKPGVQDYRTKGAPLAVIGNWDDSIWNVPFSDDWVGDDGFTHWMPLPAPPALQPGGEQ